MVRLCLQTEKAEKDESSVRQDNASNTTYTLVSDPGKGGTHSQKRFLPFHGFSYFLDFEKNKEGGRAPQAPPLDPSLQIANKYVRLIVKLYVKV